MGGPPSSKPASAPWVPVVAIIVVPLAFLGGYMLLTEGSKSEVSGTLRLGEETIPIDRCESGVLGKDAPPTRPRWHGVDLFSASEPGQRVRLIDDPEKGKLLTIRRGDDPPVTVDRATCTRHAIELRETGVMLFDHHGMEGSIDLDCPTIAGKLSFASCHDGT